MGSTGKPGGWHRQ